MPGLKTTTYGTGDYGWLLNTDGLDEAITGVLDISTFTEATDFPDGYIPSGTPVNVADVAAIVPWDDAAGAKLGFVKGDFKTNGDENVNVAFIARGNIVVSKVPVTFTEPSTAAQPQFNYWS